MKGMRWGGGVVGLRQLGWVGVGVGVRPLEELSATEKDLN